MMSDRRAYNSTLRPRSKKRQAEIAAGKHQKKPAPKGATAIERMLGEGILQRGSTFKSKARKPLKTKPTGQLKVFLEIWEERPHVSEISGKPLFDLPDDRKDQAAMRAWVSQFSHLLPKGQYRRLRNDKRNIVLKTLAEHELWGKWGLLTHYHCDHEHVAAWVRTRDLAIELRNEQNGITAAE